MEYTSDSNGIFTINEKKYNVYDILPTQDSISSLFKNNNTMFDVYYYIIDTLDFINNNHNYQLKSPNSTSIKRAEKRKVNKPYIDVNELLSKMSLKKDKAKKDILITQKENVNPSVTLSKLKPDISFFNLEAFIKDNKLYSCDNRRLCIINMIMKYSNKNHTLKFNGSGVIIKLLKSQICNHRISYKNDNRLLIRYPKGSNARYNKPQLINTINSRGYKNDYCPFGYSSSYIGGKNKTRKNKNKKNKTKKNKRKKTKRRKNRRHRVTKKRKS